MSAVLPGPVTAPNINPPPMRRDVAAAPVVEPKPPVEASAADRLAHSRSQLRNAMMDIAHPPKREPLLGASSTDWLQGLLGRVKALPGAAIVVESIESWWQQHPLRTAGAVAEEASRAFVRPIAQRSPQTLILGAAAFGALFALTRPWRWLLRPALFVGVVPQLVAHAMKRMPVDAWIKVAAASLGRKTAAAASRPRSAKPAPPSEQTSTP